jgi:hypothetical protein
MIRKISAIAALLALAPFAGQAATEANFGVNTTADLVELCDAKPDSATGIAAVNFCHGFAQGAVIVEMQNQGTSWDRKLFCLPNPLPTRNETLRDFIQWARTSQDRMIEAPTNSLVRFLSERFPCAKTR